MTSVGEQFPKEVTRVRNLLDQYRAIGPEGAFGAAALEVTLDRAEKAQSSGDIIRILRSYTELTDCK